jgi:uroporphyrinogen-III synthase
MKPKLMSRTLAVEIATKTMAVINPANRGLRVLDLLEKHGFRPVAEPEIEIVSDQARLVGWLRDTFKV